MSDLNGPRKGKQCGIALIFLVVIIFPLTYYASTSKVAAQPHDGYCCYLGGISEAWAGPRDAQAIAVLEQRSFSWEAEELQKMIAEREIHLNTLMHELSLTPENNGNGAGDFTSECVIATAAYGSNIAPQVQFLRDFRDDHIKTTITGSAFLNVFNSWYYSFSPQVAAFESEQPLLQQTVRIVILPLLSILQLAENGYSMNGGESGSITAGLIASSLIGLVYFSPLALVILRKRNRMQRTIVFALGAAGASIVMIIIGLVFLNSIILMAATAVFVLAILGASATGFARLTLFVAARPAIRVTATRLWGHRQYRIDALLGVSGIILGFFSISLAYASSPELQVPVGNLGREEIVKQLERLAEIKIWLEDTRRIESLFPYSEDSYELTKRWNDYLKDALGPESQTSSITILQQAEEIGKVYQRLSSKVYNDGVADRHFVLKEPLSTAILQLHYSVADMVKITGGQDPPDPYYSSILALGVASENFNTYSLELKEETFGILDKTHEVRAMSNG